MTATRNRGRVGAAGRRPALLELAGPDVGVAPLVRGDPAERGGPRRVLLDLGERVVEEDGVALEAEVVEALGASRRTSSPSYPALDSRRMSSEIGDAIRSGPRYLSAADVAAAMPPLEERLRLAERTMVALVSRRRAAAEDRDPSPARRLVRPRDAGRTCAVRTRTGPTTSSA